jgi:regulatory protein
MVTLDAIRTNKNGTKIILKLSSGEDIVTSPEVLLDHNLKKGQQLTQDTINTLKDKQKYTKLLTKAINLISYRPHTKKELKQKLYKLSPTKQQLDSIYKKLDSLNYLNEAGIAINYAESLKNKLKGPIFVTQKLKQKGIDSKLIVDTLSTVYPDDHAIVTICKKRLNKLTRGLNKPSEKEKKRLYSNLIRNGFPPNIVIKLINSD